MPDREFKVIIRKILTGHENKSGGPQGDHQQRDRKKGTNQR